MNTLMKLAEERERSQEMTPEGSLRGEILLLRERLKLMAENT